MTLKAAYAATVSPLGATGVPGRSTDALPLGPLPGGVYPDPHVESLKKPKGAFGASGFPAFAGTMAVERVATGFRWAEGPVYFPAGRYVLFSDIPNNRIMRYCEDDGHLSVFRQPSMNSNGNTIDREGRLITCEHGGRRVTRTELDGTITVIADKYNGKRLNSPNDCVVASDGAIWFTDPAYGIGGNYEGVKSRRSRKAQRLPRRSEVRRHQGRGRRFRGAERPRLLSRREETLRDRHRLHRRPGQPVAPPRLRRGSQRRQAVERQGLCRYAQAEHQRRRAH
jgi:gluconolactonase